MKRLDLYIGRAVFSATLLAWLVVAVLDGVFMLLGELGDIGRGDYALSGALGYVALSLPARACAAFPMAALIGTVLGLGNLAAQRELDALRLAGCSVVRLGMSVLYTGVVMVVLAALLGEVLAPGSAQLARELRSQAIFRDVSVQREAGFWVRDGQRFIQVGRSEVDGSLSEVTVYHLGSGPRLDSVDRAARAVPLEANGWRLEVVRASRFHQDRIETGEQTRAHWPELMDVRLARLLAREAATLSLPELAEYIDYLRRSGADVALHALNYWQRWAAPPAALAMLLLAVGLVLGPLARRPLGQRLLIAVLVGILFKLVAEVVAHAGLVYGAPAPLAAFAPVLLAALVSWLLLRRAH